MFKNNLVAFTLILACGQISAAEIKGNKLFLGCRYERSEAPVLIKDGETDWFRVDITCLQWNRTIITDDKNDAVFTKFDDAGSTELYLFSKTDLLGGRSNDLKDQVVNKYSHTKKKTVFGKDAYCRAVSITNTEFDFRVIMSCELRNNEYTEAIMNASS